MLNMINRTGSRKSHRPLLLIICIALAKCSLAQYKAAHFDQDFILREIAAKRQRLQASKMGLAVRFSHVEDSPASTAEADSATTNSVFLNIVKDWNYKYVFNPDYLLAAPANSNITPLVAKQLRIKMPYNNYCDAMISGRFAYCHRDSIWAQMPEASVIDKLLAIYRNDSLSMEYDSLLAKFIRHDSLMKVSHGCFPPRQSNNNEDIIDCFKKLQNWFDYSTKKMQARQFLLLNPYYNRIENAIKRVAEQDRYDYVFKDNFHHQGVKDISADVIKEMQLADN